MKELSLVDMVERITRGKFMEEKKMEQKQEYCEHEHMHAHHHTHKHVHSHTHGEEMDTMEEVTALLSYMTDHNRHHAEELADMGYKLRSMGKEDAADMIVEGVKAFTRANELFAEALKLVK